MSVIGQIDPNKIVTIYGAGISGLILAYELRKKNINIVIKEKSNLTGGKIQTSRTPYGLVEKAANAIYANTPVIELLNDLKLKPIRCNPSLKRLIFHNGKIKQSPITKWQVAKAIMKSFKKIPKSAKAKNATLYDFLVPLLGHDISYNIASSGLYGIYASNSQEIHRSAVFKYDKFDTSYRKYFLDWLKKRKVETQSLGKPVSISFEGGMQELIEALTLKLADNIQLNSKDSLAGENSIVCTDAISASELTGLARLKDISYQKVFSTTVFCENTISDLDKSFGLLFSPQSDYTCLGILNNNAIFSRKDVPDVQSYTVISQDNKWKENLLKLSPNLKILEAEEQVWEKGIPVYNYQRIQIVDEIKSQLPKGICLFGNYTGSLSLREIIIEARKFAAAQSLR